MSQPQFPGAPTLDGAALRDVFVAANRLAVCAALGRTLVHDLRTPLQAVMLVAGLAEDHGTDMLDPEMLGQCRQSSHMLARAVDRIDALLQPVAVDETAAPLSLADLSRSTAAVLQSRYPEAVTLDATLAALPAVAAVEGHLQHAVLNLLLNACEAVDDGDDVDVVVDGWVDAGAVVLRVRDSGPGVAAAVADRLFEPFVTTRDRPGPVGLGLFVAKDLVTRNGGTIDLIQSQTGGAAFAVRVPVWTAATGSASGARPG